MSVRVPVHKPCDAADLGWLIGPGDTDAFWLMVIEARMMMAPAA
jgi:hypothetical protein